ncbi:MAG: DUF4837 family protein [Bacteroidales bacterium]|nr:DUF4837 family protein [Bacteroidales bacterium]
MKYLIQIIISLTILIVACRSESRTRLSGLTGSSGEVLVVMSENAWNGGPGETCRELFNQAYEMLPQYEPVFDVVHITFESYKDFFLLHRNVLIAEISPGITESGILVQQDQYAASQLTITIQSAGDSTFAQQLTENGERIITLFDELERQRITAANRQNTDRELISKMQNKHGVSIVLPEDYRLALDTTGFTWLAKETGSVIQGILIYEYPYHAPEDLSPKNLIEKRDEMLKRYIPGSVPGSFMTTEKEFQPLWTTYSLRGRLNIAEMRGLWKMENGISMGGPFISITRTDVQKQYFTTIEGFVYAAGFEKRNYMRELEAIVLSME